MGDAMRRRDFHMSWICGLASAGAATVVAGPNIVFVQCLKASLAKFGQNRSAFPQLRRRQDF